MMDLVINICVKLTEPKQRKGNRYFYVAGYVLSHKKPRKGWDWKKERIKKWIHKECGKIVQVGRNEGFMEIIKMSNYVSCQLARKIKNVHVN